MNFEKRLKLSQELLSKNKWDFFLIENPYWIYYFTKIYPSFGRLIISKNKICLFVDNRYLEIAKKICVCEVQLYSKENIKNFLLEEGKTTNIAVVDSSSLKLIDYENLENFFNSIKEKLYSLHSVNNPLKDIRKIKSKEEIELMRKSAELNFGGYQHILKYLQEGITEESLALEYEIFCRKNGAQRLAFDPIVCFGENASRPHHKAGKTKLKKNDVVLIDVGVVLEHYTSDMTRTVFFKKVDPLIEKFYSIVKEAQQRAFEMCKPNIKIKDVDLAARNYIESRGYKDLFIHSTGHGIGLEAHEYPSINFMADSKEDILQEGMAITIEPGLYKSGLGGIRIEDTVIITKDGFENLYNDKKSPYL